MIDIEHVVFDKMQPEMRALLQATLPNLGFFLLLQLCQEQINLELANLNTSCTSDEFQQKYNNLLLERNFYASFERVAKRFNETQAEEK